MTYKNPYVQADRSNLSQNSYIKFYLPKIIREYVSCIREMINIANQKYHIFLLPEKFYYNRLGKIQAEWITDAVFDAF